MKHMNRIQRDTESLPTLANMYRCRFRQQKNSMVPSFSMLTFLRFLSITIRKVQPQAEGELMAKPKPSYKLRPRLYDTTWLGNAAFSLMILMTSKLSTSISGGFPHLHLMTPKGGFASGIPPFKQPKIPEVVEFRVGKHTHHQFLKIIYQWAIFQYL